MRHRDGRLWVDSDVDTLGDVDGLVVKGDRGRLHRDERHCDVLSGRELTEEYRHRERERVRDCGERQRSGQLKVKLNPAVAAV